MSKAVRVTVDEMVREYITRMMGTVESVTKQLDDVSGRFQPDGFMLLECVMLDSSQCGHYVILPYGGRATYMDIPTTPVSPRGLASDMSVVKMYTAKEAS